MTQHKLSVTYGFNVKAANNDTLTIEGYANTTSVDRHSDVIVSEAWTKGGLDNFLKNPIILAFHDYSQPIGKAVDVSVTDKGLKLVAEISSAAGNIYNLIKEGILSTFSVGFYVKDAEYDSETDIFVIKDLELYEVSVVSIPANPDATFSVRKALGSEQEFNQFKEEFVMSQKQGQEEPKTGLTAEDMQKSIEAALAAQAKTFENVLNTLKEAQKPEQKEEPVVMAKEGVEDLIKEVEKRFEEREATLKEALAGLENELKEKAQEIDSLVKSKMSFEDKSSSATKLSEKEIDNAVLLSTILTESIEETNYGKQLLEKAGPHLNTTADWEQEFSKRIENDIRQRLVMEPLFRNVEMNAATMPIMINPETGYGEWIQSSSFRSSDGSSTGTASDHKLQDAILTAHKLVAKEFLGYEEEEDSIIPLLPVIRDALVRKMGKASDRALLIGNAGSATPEGDLFPFNGVSTIANTASKNVDVSISGAGIYTVKDLQDVRRKLGVWGLDPNDLVYVVSKDVYFDLLEDPDFRTMDKVGSSATILTGQIGEVAGSPVVVSGEFPAKAAGKPAVVCLNASNFIIGNLRTARIERDKVIQDQKTILVASRRMGFLPLVGGEAAAVGNWVA